MKIAVMTPNKTRAIETDKPNRHLISFRKSNCRLWLAADL